MLALLLTGCPGPPEIQVTPEPLATPAPTAQPLFSISGKLAFKNIGVINAQVVLSGTSQRTVTTDDKGNFTFSGLANGTYTVEPAKLHWVFTPAQTIVTVNSSDPNSISFTGAAESGYTADSWGYIWDTNYRSAANWDTANRICNEDLGGRLPTPTELYRNSRHTGCTGELALPGETAWLWTNIEAYAVSGNAQYVVVRMDSGDTNWYQGSNTTCYYRCVWPDKERDAFYGTYIYGPPGDEGFTVAINGGHYAIDKYDRPLLSYSAAMREAAFYHAALPTETGLVACVQAGLPNGRDLYLFTSDKEGYNSNADFLVGIVKWQGVDTACNDIYPQYATHQYMNNALAYRCPYRAIGTTITKQINPKAILYEWTDSQSKLKTTFTDETAVTFTTALDTAFNAGGHAADFQDYIQLVQAGLTNGSNTLLWTADLQYSGYTGVINWLGTDTHFTGYHSTYMTHAAYGSGARPFRIVYYPVDADYNGPTAQQCTPSNYVYYEYDLGNGAKRKIWVDKYDRVDKTFGEAIRDCYSRGGQLASARDLIELIRQGLPNGTGIWNWTSDKANYNATIEIKWSGTNPGFSCTYGSGGNIYDRVVDATSTAPYRCLWTNEFQVP